MDQNDLDKFIADRTLKNHRFPNMIEAAQKRRNLARDLATVRKQMSSLSQAFIAAAMGTSPSTVNRLENGADVRLSTLQRYAEVLGCDLKVELVPKTE